MSFVKLKHADLTSFDLLNQKTILWIHLDLQIHKKCLRKGLSYLFLAREKSEGAPWPPEALEKNLRQVLEDVCQQQYRYVNMLIIIT